MEHVHVQENYKQDLDRRALGWSLRNNYFGNHQCAKCSDINREIDVHVNFQDHDNFELQELFRRLLLPLQIKCQNNTYTRHAGWSFTAAFDYFK